MLIFFFFNDTATTEIYTLSLHDALPISRSTTSASRSSSAGSSTGAASGSARAPGEGRSRSGSAPAATSRSTVRSEEHTSELQSRQYLVCRLLLEKKKKQSYRIPNLTTSA